MVAALARSQRCVLRTVGIPGPFCGGEAGAKGARVAAFVGWGTIAHMQNSRLHRDRVQAGTTELLPAPDDGFDD